MWLFVGSRQQPAQGTMSLTVPAPWQPSQSCMCEAQQTLGDLFVQGWVAALECRPPSVIGAVQWQAIRRKDPRATLEAWGWQKWIGCSGAGAGFQRLRVGGFIASSSPAAAPQSAGAFCSRPSHVSSQ